MTIDDHQLRARFGELRRHDADHAPPFRALLEGEPRVHRGPRARRMRAWWALAAAASVVLAAGVALGKSAVGDLLRRFGDSADARSVSSDIIGWSSPTASLLRPPGSDLVEPTSILSSVLDGVSSMTGYPGGDTP